MKRWLILGVPVALVGGALFVGTNLSLDSSEDSASAAATPIVPLSTATIVQRTMVATESFDGTLGYAGEGVIISGISGTYTKLPQAGDILRLGDEIYEVDGTQSSFLLYGSRPAYRPLDRDSENGPDIKQLEESLQLLGHLDTEVKPDWSYRLKTERAVRRWERKTNQARDGVIDPGQVTFLPGDVRITEVVPELGSRSAAGSVLAYTSETGLVVTFELEADRRDILAVDDTVSVELPDGAEAGGPVLSIDSVARTLAGASEPSVEVTVELADTSSLGELDGAEVTVEVVRQTRPDVLTVPVDALLALREGGYALELVAADGSTYLTLAEVGLFDDDGVEVSGEFSAGDTVVVPA